MEQKKQTTTIEISIDTHTSLTLMKVHPRQSYDEVIVKLILGAKWKTE